MLIGCWLLLAIRCRGQITSPGQDRKHEHYQAQARLEDAQVEGRAPSGPPGGILGLGLILTISFAFPGAAPLRRSAHAACMRRVLLSAIRRLLIVTIGALRNAMPVS